MAAKMRLFQLAGPSQRFKLKWLSRKWHQR